MNLRCYILADGSKKRFEVESYRHDKHPWVLSASVPVSRVLLVDTRFGVTFLKERERAKAGELECVPHVHSSDDGQAAQTTVAHPSAHRPHTRPLASRRFRRRREEVPFGNGPGLGVHVLQVGGRLPVSCIVVIVVHF